MATIDKERVRPFASAFDIASALGIETKKSGKTVTMRCINPNHSDKHMGNCVLYQNGCHCFACGADYDVFGMVRAIRGCSMNDAVKAVAEICHIQVTSADMRQSQPPISSAELELIGLHNTTIRDSANGRLILSDPLGKMWRENRSEFKRMCRDKAKEKAEDIRISYENYRTFFIELGAKDLEPLLAEKNSAMSKIRTCEKIVKRVS